ncbi:MAG: hypothetical protein JWO38_6975 [Gemmataceae bacterium]|nr:hypothetical protein [Gemmataceae bacterium]
MPTPSKEYADEVLIRRLAYGDTIPDAARIAKVSERTVFRRLNNPTFRNRLSATQAAALSPAYGMLTTGLTDACFQLTQLVRHPNPHVGFKAAKAVVDLTLKMREQVEVEDRVTALERITKHKAKFGQYPPPPEDDPDEDDPGPGGPDGGPTGGWPGGPGSSSPPPGMPFPAPPAADRPASPGVSAPAPAGGGAPDLLTQVSPRATDQLARAPEAPSEGPEAASPHPAGGEGELAADSRRQENRPGDCQILTRGTGPRPFAHPRCRAGCHTTPARVRPNPATRFRKRTCREAGRTTSGKYPPVFTRTGRARDSVRGLPDTDKPCQREGNSPRGFRSASPPAEYRANSIHAPAAHPAEGDVGRRQGGSFLRSASVVRSLGRNPRGIGTSRISA